MNGKTPHKELISPQEALKLFEHSTTEEIIRAKDLCDAYKNADRTVSSDIYWNFLQLLSFVYGAGRIQGIREERAKRKC